MKIYKLVVIGLASLLGVSFVIQTSAICRHVPGAKGSHHPKALKMKVVNKSSDSLSINKDETKGFGIAKYYGPGGLPTILLSGGSVTMVVCATRGASLGEFMGMMMTLTSDHGKKKCVLQIIRGVKAIKEGEKLIPKWKEPEAAAYICHGYKAKIGKRIRYGYEYVIK